MNIEFSVGNLSELLLYIVPGYISLKIQERYRHTLKKEKMDSILYSVLYSFIIGSVFLLIIKGFSLLNAPLAQQINTAPIKEVSHIILAVIWGYLLSKIPSFRIAEWIEKRFNIHHSLYSTVWEKAMESDHGAWARVYLKNGFVYVGQLLFYTNDVNTETREILLSNFRISTYNLEKDSDKGSLFSVIADHTKEDESMVLLKNDDVISIEIFKSKK